MTGQLPYSDEIEVKSIRPERTNAALPYLWARQRIMLLSDYNLLKQSDDRVKEITDLGLTYNLLTAYTSFVVVDSEVRNSSGRTATVNQPLPLPEGVSDYAVGGIMARSVASPMMKGKMAAAPAEGRMLPAKAEDEAAKQSSIPHLSVTINKITVTGGLRKDAVRSTMELQFNTLQTCFQNMALRGKVEVRITIDANGVVKDVRVTRGTKNEAVHQCVLQQIKTWKFPAATAGRDTEATVTFLIGS